MPLPDIRVRDGITFEWLDDPATPHPRWRARMSREVFAALVNEKLALAATRPGCAAPDSLSRRTADSHAHNQKQKP